MFFLTLLACTPPALVERQAAFSDDGEAVLTVESPFQRAGLADTPSWERYSPAMLSLDGELLPVDLDVWELGWSPGGMHQTPQQPRWMRSQGYAVVGITLPTWNDALSAYPEGHGIVDDLTGELLWTSMSEVLPTPDGSSLVSIENGSTAEHVKVLWHDPLTGVPHTTHEVVLPGGRPACELVGFEPAGDLVLSCWNESIRWREAFVVASEGEPVLLAEVDDCAKQARTSSSPWGPTGESVWEVAVSGGWSEKSEVERLGDEVLDLDCLW